MKKYIFLAILTITLACGSLMAVNYTSPELCVSESCKKENCCKTHASSEGQRCNGTVGCDCPGFSPILNGNEWQKAYCKKCGHHRNNHR